MRVGKREVVYPSSCMGTTEQMARIVKGELVNAGYRATLRKMGKWGYVVLVPPEELHSADYAIYGDVPEVGT